MQKHEKRTLLLFGCILLPEIIMGLGYISIPTSIEYEREHILLQMLI